MDSILKAISGREMEPAGDFLRYMDTDYRRALGWTCSNCHVIGQYDADTKKDKRIARQMQAMTLVINSRELVKVKELKKEDEAVTCAMCHKGTNEPKGKKSVWPAPAPGANARPGQQ